MDQRVVVSDDGSVEIVGGLGKLKVRGLTLDDAESEIKYKIQPVQPHAEVMITMDDWKTKWREAIVPKSGYHIQPGDYLYINMLPCIAYFPITGTRLVEPDGRSP